MEHSRLIRVRKVKGKGRGVFSRQAIPKGTVIEKVPIVKIPISAFVDGYDNSSLRKYFFYWNERFIAVCLGYGSLYNHSYEPNARYYHCTDSMEYVAIRDIEPDEEITINYNYDPKDTSDVGFSVV